MAKVSDTNIYGYDNTLDGRDFLLGTDWNNARKTKSFKLENLRYFILQGLDSSNNGFVINNGYILVGNILKINAGWQWLINGLLCTNEEDIEIPLEYSTEGFVRIDSIYVNSNNEFLIISGQESETIAITPSIPVNSILAFSINIFDSLIETGPEPVLGNVYLKKEFDNSQDITESGTNIISQFNIHGYSTIILNGAITSFSGFSNLDIINNPTISENPHEGKLILLINRSGHDITLNNNIEAATFKFIFDSSENIIIPNNGKLFLKFTNGFLIDIIKSWTTKEDVGLSNVNNTSDLDKPISSATQIALNNKLSNKTTDYSSATLLLTGSENFILNDGTNWVKITYNNIKAVLKSYFDIIYQSIFGTLITNSTVTGTYDIDWSKDTWDLILTGNTTLTQSNLPSSGTKVISLYVSGNFTLSYPSGWTTFITGSYSGTATMNKIVVEFISAGRYNVTISKPS